MSKNNYKLEKIKGDASFRSFFRKTEKTKRSIIVHASKEKEKNIIFQINQVLFY